MDDWIRHAQELEQQESARRLKEQQEAESQTVESLDSEKNWIERTRQRVQAIREQGIPIKLEQNPSGLVLSHRGVVEIQLQSPKNFWVRFRDVYPSSRLMLSRPITVQHHRIVRLRVLNDHNIEEILKFASLGMDNYVEVARYERIERNLEHLMESTNQEEHVEGS